jgi:pyruvate/2-oxoacid:ferredoxin oxidoreductase beta subunit
MQFSERESMIAAGLTMPFCKGCGHAHVMKKLDEALVSLGLEANNICLVTDIGCIGLADKLFPPLHTVHTTHGRSTAFATGIALADTILAEAKLKTIVLIGDGGAMIGLLHLVNAALLNTDVTVLLCNNFLFGMTGGQHSAFSPLDFITPTTPAGSLIPPIDICSVLRDSGAQFIERTTATDRELAGTIADAINHPGFAVVEILELCPEHAVGKNDLTGNSLKEMVERNAPVHLRPQPGIARKEFGKLYKEKFPAASDPRATDAGVHTNNVRSGCLTSTGIVIAGSAGERVQSSARRLCEAAARCGLSCTQKNDNPVTQGSGFSLSEVILSPREIHYTGIQSPAAVILVSQDGVNEVAARGVFETMTDATLLIADASLELPAGRGTVVKKPFRKEFGGTKAAAKAVEEYVRLTEIVPQELLQGS